MATTRERYEQFFKEADRDKSGALTVDELIDAILEKDCRVDRTTLKVYFKSVDLTGDRKVTLDEYMKAMGFEKMTKKEYMLSSFNEFDTDENGYLTKDELAKALGKMDMSSKEIDRLMMLVDESKDGKVDKREFISKVFGVRI